GGAGTAWRPRCQWGSLRCDCGRPEAACKPRLPHARASDCRWISSWRLCPRRRSQAGLPSHRIARYRLYCLVGYCRRPLRFCVSRNREVRRCDMKTLNLQTAVAEIVGAIQRRKENESWRTFFFVIGAGISSPSIPLAWEIEQRCRAEIAKRELEMPPETGSAFERYQSCMERAFSQAAERQQFLHEEINGKPISAANFRLA